MLHSAEMTTPVSRDRWTEAQSAEREYWRWPAIDPREFARVLADLADAAVWARQHFPGDHPPAGDWLEIGIGPMGIGCIHFLDEVADRRLVGVDPLEQLAASDVTLPALFEATLFAARSTYEHRVATGEATGLPESSFGFAVLHNMLDHVQDPGAVLRETRRVLCSNGILFLACDTHSMLSQLRHRIYTRRRAEESWLVRAHPFRFRPSEIFGLLDASGFSIRCHNLTSKSLAETVGRGTRLRILAEPRTKDT